MRRLAILLLGVNLALWGYWSILSPETARNSRQAGGDGRLPRVAELELLTETVGIKPEQAVATGKVAAGQAQVGEQVVAPVSVSDAARLYCVRLGWFESAEGARSALDSLPAPRGGGQADVVAITRELPPFHWVLIPPSASREAALQLLYDIQRRGIDSYLVTEGAQNNAISLGLFESREAAEQVLVQRNAENLHAVLALFPRNQISYALVFEAAYVPGSQELRADHADFSARFESVEINGCEGVATLKESP